MVGGLRYMFLLGKSSKNIFFCYVFLPGITHILSGLMRYKEILELVRLRSKCGQNGRRRRERQVPGRVRRAEGSHGTVEAQFKVSDGVMGGPWGVRTGAGWARKSGELKTCTSTGATWRRISGDDADSTVILHCVSNAD